MSLLRDLRTCQWWFESRRPGALCPTVASESYLRNPKERRPPRQTNKTKERVALLGST